MFWVVFDFLQFSGIGIGGGHPKVDLAKFSPNDRVVTNFWLNITQSSKSSKTEVWKFGSEPFKTFSQDRG